MRNKKVIDRDNAILPMISRYAIYLAEDIYDIIKSVFPEMSPLQSASFIRRNMEKTETGFYILKPKQKQQPFADCKKELDNPNVANDLIHKTVSFSDDNKNKAAVNTSTKHPPMQTPKTKTSKVIEKIRFAEKYNIPYEGLIELIKEMKL